MFAGNGAAAGASLIQACATHWSINSADGQVQDIVTFANAAAIDVSDYLFV